MSEMPSLPSRKQEHLDLCANGDVEARRSTLLDEVHLLHEAIPDLSVVDIDPSVELLGRRLSAPLVISGMTGGTARAGVINRALATAAQKHGLAMGLGSQRVLWAKPDTRDTFSVRDVAPDVLLLGNIGAVQARDAGPRRVLELAESIGADALCIHLNVAQELVQDDGDRDFRGCLECIGELAARLPLPVVVKETGCGMGPSTLRRLREAGVRTVDVAGAGGTTWTGVEALRGSARQQELGQALREWGIPTAASLIFARRAGLSAIASGGLRSPLDVVRALALGAEAAGMALPFLRAFEQGGVDGVLRHADRLIDGVRALMLLVGARSLVELRRAPRVLGPGLRAWTEPQAGDEPRG